MEVIMKKFISAILAAAMILSVSTGTVVAADTTSATQSTAETIVLKETITQTKEVLPASGAETRVDYPLSRYMAFRLLDDGTYGAYFKNTAFQYVTPDLDVVIPSTYNDLPVTSIGEEAFYCIDDRKTSGREISVVIPDSVTSIGEAAFAESLSLISVQIPDSVTSIGEAAFAVCCSLRNISVSPNNTAYQSIDGSLYTKDGKTLMQYALGKKRCVVCCS
jgi:hypothetical protein